MTTPLDKELWLCPCCKAPTNVLGDNFRACIKGCLFRVGVAPSPWSSGAWWNTDGTFLAISSRLPASYCRIGTTFICGREHKIEDVVNWLCPCCNAPTTLDMGQHRNCTMGCRYRSGKEIGWDAYLWWNSDGAKIKVADDFAVYKICQYTPGPCGRHITKSTSVVHTDNAELCPRCDKKAEHRVLDGVVICGNKDCDGCGSAINFLKKKEKVEEPTYMSYSDRVRTVSVYMYLPSGPTGRVKSTSIPFNSRKQAELTKLGVDLWSFAGKTGKEGYRIIKSIKKRSIILYAFEELLILHPLAFIEVIRR